MSPEPARPNCPLSVLFAPQAQKQQPAPSPGPQPNLHHPETSQQASLPRTHNHRPSGTTAAPAVTRPDQVKTRVHETPERSTGMNPHEPRTPNRPTSNHINDQTTERWARVLSFAALTPPPSDFLSQPPVPRLADCDVSDSHLSACSCRCSA